MTRDFNKQQRNGPRPSFHNPSPNTKRQGEEQSSNSARPRLNRDTVDRAWQSGAQQRHADYRPRQNNGQAPRSFNGQPPRSFNGQAPRGNWHNQRPEYSSRDRSDSGNRFQSNNRDNARGFERTPHNNQRPDSRSFEAGRRNFDDRRFGERRGYEPRRDNTGSGNDERRGYGPRREGTGAPQSERHGYEQRRDNTGERRGGYEDRRNGMGTPQSERRGYEPRREGMGERRGGYEPRREGPGARNSYRPQEYGTRRPGPGAHSERDIRHGERPFQGTPQHAEQHPRWQSRAWARPENALPEQESARQPQPEERFEGDYEQFTNTKETQTRPAGKPFRENRRNTSEVPERHVTRLPDGRVLKGPRPVQRKNAEFWTDVSSDAEELLEKVQVSETPEVDAEPEEKGGPSKQERKNRKRVTRVDTVQKETRPDQGHEPTAPKKPGKHVASTTTREKKPRAPKVHTKGPRPSQRGFKWPTTS